MTRHGYQYSFTDQKLRAPKSHGPYLCSVIRPDGATKTVHISVWLPFDKVLWGSHVATTMRLPERRNLIKRTHALHICSTEFNDIIVEPMARVLRIEHARAVAEWMESP